jgi:predicted nucleic acid-binding protein
VSLVLDASLTLSWYFEDEKLPTADALLDKVGAEGAIAPSVWRLEVANGFLSAIRRKRIDAAFRDSALQHLGSLPIEIDPEPNLHAWTVTSKLAERLNLTIYDAAYLELAQRRRLPFATLDEALRAAARACGVELLGVAP